MRARAHTHSQKHIPVMAPSAAVLDGYLETRNGQKKKQLASFGNCPFYPSPSAWITPNNGPKGLHSLFPIAQKYTHKAGNHKREFYGD